MRKFVLSLSAGAVLGIVAGAVAASPTDRAVGPNARIAPGPTMESVVLRPDQLIQSSQLAAYPPGRFLIAQRDVVGFDGDGAFPAGSTSGRTDRASELPAAAARELGVELPRPGRTSATLATLALGLFFFLRRIV